VLVSYDTNSRVSVRQIKNILILLPLRSLKIEKGPPMGGPFLTLYVIRLSGECVGVIHVQGRVPDLGGVG